MQLVTKILPYITWIFTAICWWRVFSKANIAGWKALIPFYSDYTRYKIAGKKSMYWGYLVVTALKQIYSIVSIAVLAGTVIAFMSDGTFHAGGIEMKIISWGLTLLIAFFDVYIGRRLARKFGKTDAFGWGLGLIPLVFVPILAFGKAEFQEKE